MAKVLDYFQSTMKGYLECYAKARLILLIDFDKKFVSRLTQIKDTIPVSCRERVYVIGSLKNPEKLTEATKLSAEAIGKKLAGECDSGTSELWAHD